MDTPDRLRVPAVSSSVYDILSHHARPRHVKRWDDAWFFRVLDTVTSQPALLLSSSTPLPSLPPVASLPSLSPPSIPRVCNASLQAGVEGFSGWFACSSCYACATACTSHFYALLGGNACIKSRCSTPTICVDRDHSIHLV